MNEIEKFSIPQFIRIITVLTRTHAFDNVDDRSACVFDFVTLFR